MVPREPTAEMMKAATQAHLEAISHALRGQCDYDIIWKAMFDAYQSSVAA